MTENAPRFTQRSLLAVVMFVILLGSVALAWWLVRERTIPAKFGAEILADIRGRGLAHYWGDGGELQCFVERDSAGTAVAWKIALRERTDTGYRGARIAHKVPEPLLEKWVLTANARHGQYRGPAPKVKANTEIILDDAKIAVIQLLREGPINSSVATPDNYIPEGMEPLVAAQVLRAGKEAVFKTLLNEEAIVSGQVHFGTEKMTPIDAHTVRTSTIGQELAQKQDYIFTDDGRLEKIVAEDGKVTSTAVSGDELLAAFPGDEELAKIIAGWKSTPQSQPTTQP